jgi:hypothetical protein
MKKKKRGGIYFYASFVCKLFMMSYKNRWWGDFPPPKRSEWVKVSDYLLPEV